MTKLELIELIVLGIILIAAVIYYVPKAFKEHWFQKITDTAKEGIKEAEEKFPGEGHGSEKKNYVLEKVQLKCDELKIPYNLIWKLISKFVDNVIDNYNVLKK